MSDVYDRSEFGWKRDNGQVHVLKIAAGWYGRLRDGSKTCEVRRHDRDFQVGDAIRFRITDDEEDDLLASGVWVITHVQPLAHVPGFPGAANWCVLSLREVDDE